MNTCICHVPDGAAVYICCDECKDSSPSCLERIGKNPCVDGQVLTNETPEDFELVPCPHDPTGKCDGDHAPEGDYTE